jgi:hypothetical protein
LDEVMATFRDVFDIESLSETKMLMLLLFHRKRFPELVHPHHPLQASSIETYPDQFQTFRSTMMR